MAGLHEDASFALPAPGNPYTQAWLIGAADRALKSFATSLAILLGGGQTGLDLLHIDWRAALLTAAGTAVASVLTSVISAPIGDPGTTSLLPGGR